MSAQRIEETAVHGASQAVFHTVFRGVDQMLADARSRLDRLSAHDAYREVLWEDALLVDIRPDAQRAQEGEVHEALHPLVIERNVLEWRFDPVSSARIPEAAYDARVIVLCQEGYTSSLAADALQRLGISRATDVVGGFMAWQAANLPVACGWLYAGDDSPASSSVSEIELMQ